MSATPAVDVPDDLGDVSRGLAGAGLAVCAWSTGTVIAKHIDMGGLAIGAYRFTLFAVAIVVWMWLRKQPMSLRAFRASTWGGIALGADIALFFTAVKETSIVNATIIGSLQPVVVGVIAARFFGERIRGRDALWSLVAIAGVFVVVLSGPDAGDQSLRGDLLAVGAMFSWSAYFIASKDSRRRITSTEFTAGTAIWTALICTPLAVAVGQDMSMPSAASWGWLVAMTVGAGIVGHVLMNWSLVRIPLWVGSTFTLLIPVFSALLAWAFLDEALTAVQGVAMCVVIASLGRIVHDQRRQVTAGIATEEVVT